MLSLSRLILRRQSTIQLSRNLRISTKLCSEHNFTPLEQQVEGQGQGQGQEAITNKSNKRVYLTPEQIRKKKKKKKQVKKSSKLQENKPQENNPQEFNVLLNELREPENNSNDLKVEDVINTIDSFRPIENEIGKKAFEMITNRLNRSFNKHQLLDYLDFLEKNDPDIMSVVVSDIKRLPKKSLIEKVIQDIWNINISDKVIIEEVLETMQYQLKPYEKFLLDSRRSNVISNMKKCNVKPILESNKLRISGTESDLNFVDREFKKILNDIKHEELDISKFKSEKNLMLNKIQYIANVYFEKKGSGGIYEMYSRFPANIELAKRLLTWSVDKNPHIKDEVFEIENLSQMEFISYKNDDTLPWYGKGFDYFRLMKKDNKPMSELVFDKYDTMSKYFVNQDDVVGLKDSRMFLIPEQNQESVPEEEIFSEREINVLVEDEFATLMEEVLKKYDTDTIKKYLPKDDQSKFKHLFPELSRILANQEKAKRVDKEPREALEDLEELRKDLDSLSTDDVDISEFPNIAKLVEDFEAADSNTSPGDMESLRKELNNLIIPDANESDLLEDLTSDNPEAQSVEEPNNVETPGPLSSVQMDKLYQQLTDLSYASNLEGVDKNSILSSAFTVQFGTLLLKQKKAKPNVLFPTAKTVNSESQFEFDGTVPYMNDLVTSLPLIQPNHDRPFTESILIRLSPSKFKVQDGTNVMDNEFGNFPPVEIQCEFDNTGVLQLDTLQIISLEAIKNVSIGVPTIGSDLKISRMILGDLLKQDKDDTLPRLDVQPGLAEFLERSQLKVSGSTPIRIEPNLVLNINGKKVTYEYLNFSRKSELNFEYNGRQVNYSIINEGVHGGIRNELVIGEGELSRDEFEQLINDSIQLVNEIN